jgi:hypothetical protein
MLRTVHIGSSIPASFICDPSAEFEPGMIAELTVINNQVMATVSSGICPIGIIDDIRTKSFSAVQWQETVFTENAEITPGPGGTMVLTKDVSIPLRKANLIKNSFTSTVNCVLNATNGIVTFLAGTVCNFDVLGTGTPTEIKAIVSYTYYVPNIPGDDSTAGTGRMTVWYDRMFFQTDKYETNQAYALRANLFVSEKGLLTSRRPSEHHPSIAVVTGPPSPFNPLLECMWL